MEGKVWTRERFCTADARLFANLIVANHDHGDGQAGSEQREKDDQNDGVQTFNTFIGSHSGEQPFGHPVGHKIILSVLLKIRNRNKRLF
jgi:hypothetical protein